MIDSCIRLTLEIGGSGMPVTVKAKRGDTGRVLRIDLSDGGLPYRISEDCYGVFTGRKPDGTTLCHACTIENNMVVYTFTEQTCAAAGCITAEIRLYGSDDKLLTSASFLLEVQDTVWHAGDVESRDQMDALDQLILETVALKQEVEEKLENGDFTGTQGPAGPRGEPGPAGPQGESGADGKTPVKGEDYFTEADKQELVDAVREELPGNNMFDNIPTFDLNEMGMPVNTLDGTVHRCECDTTELMAALDRGIVRIRADIDNGKVVFKGEALCMESMSVEDGIYQVVVRATLNNPDEFYDFRLLVREGIIYLSARLDNNSADVSAEIEEALEAAKASGEFDGKDGQDGKDGADGKTPVKGIDYYTEADKTEMVNAVLAASGGNGSGTLPENVVTCDLDGSTEDEGVVPVNADTLGGYLPSAFTKSGVTDAPATLITGAGSSSYARIYTSGNVVMIVFDITLPAISADGWIVLADTGLKAGIATFTRLANGIGTGTMLRDFYFDGKNLMAFLVRSDSGHRYTGTMVTFADVLNSEEVSS